jgi:hypothetical protein
LIRIGAGFGVVLCVKAGAQLSATKQFVDQSESFTVDLVRRLDIFRAQIEHNGEKEHGLGGTDSRHEKMVLKSNGKAGKSSRGGRLVDREVTPASNASAGKVVNVQPMDSAKKNADI